MDAPPAECFIREVMELGESPRWKYAESSSGLSARRAIFSHRLTPICTDVFETNLRQSVFSRGYGVLCVICEICGCLLPSQPLFSRWTHIKKVAGPAMRSRRGRKPLSVESPLDQGYRDHRFINILSADVWCEQRLRQIEFDLRIDEMKRGAQ